VKRQRTPPSTERAIPPAPPVDPERLAELARAQRAATCEKEIQDILKRHNCGIRTVQIYINGALAEQRVEVVAIT